jgi:integrase
MPALSATAVARSTAGATRRKLADGHGLYLQVETTGAKLWRWAYRFQGAQKTMALGVYPAVSLAEARRLHQDGREVLAKGADPMHQRKADKLAQRAADGSSFESVAREWHKRWQGDKSERHAVYVLRRLEADVFPAIGHRPIAEIEAPELVRMVRDIADRGAVDIAKRALQTVSQVFRFAVAHGAGGARRNPTADVAPRDLQITRTKVNYARIDARELPDLLRAMKGYAGTPLTRLAMELLSFTFVRTGELIGARWSEFNLECARWDIPAERMKMRTAHTVPLSRQALEVLAVLHPITGQGELLFPGERDARRPMSNNTILKALDRMGYKGRMTGHGWRGLASTILHEQGFDHAHIEAQLAHQERNAVSAAYNHAQYLPQRALMMQAWADHVDAATRGNVVPLRLLAA